METTEERNKRIIESRKTLKGAYTKEALQEWGVLWPPIKGWKKQLIKGTALLDTLPNQLTLLKELNETDKHTHS